MNAVTAIATLTNRKEVEIASFDTWANVLLVKFTVGSPRFVSFKKFAALLAAAPKSLELVIPAGRKGAKPWVARITGTDSNYGLEREFLTGDIEWNGRKGAVRGTFTITECGLYQAGTPGNGGEYFVVEVIKGALKSTDISWQQAKEIGRAMDKGANAIAATIF